MKVPRLDGEIPPDAGAARPQRDAVILFNLAARRSKFIRRIDDRRHLRPMYGRISTARREINTTSTDSSV